METIHFVFLATDGQDGNGYQVEKVGLVFPSSSLALEIKRVLLLFLYVLVLSLKIHLLLLAPLVI